MRGEDQDQQAMFSYISPEARVPKDHPLCPIRIMVDNALVDLAPLFKEMYSHTGGLLPAGAALSSTAATNSLLHPY